MDDDKRKKEKDTEESPALNYEDLLNGLAQENKASQDSRTDFDGLALAELLGEEIRTTHDTEAASGHFDSIAADDYSELARQFDELDLSALSEKNVEETAAPAQEDAAVENLPEIVNNETSEVGEHSAEDKGGYASLIGELDTEGEPSPDDSGDPFPLTEDTADTALTEEDSPGNDRDMEPDSGDISAWDDTASIATLPETPDEAKEAIDISESAELDLSDILNTEPEAAAETQDEIPSPIPAEEPKQSTPTEVRKPEEDFLGLTGLAPQEIRKAGSATQRTEVLYEGVEMNFEDQTADVTLAELLLAQGKREEAADIFKRVSRNKGVTSWVAKRLRYLSATSEKP